VKILDSIWVEKWRPKELKDLVLSSGYRETFERFIKNNEIPNLLFNGTPGSGKTTVARILTSKQGILQNKNDNLLSVNGSSKEARGITFVQDVIEKFLRIPPMGKDKHRIVFIDEADYLTEYSFSALRSVIERYSIYGRFIFTCNYISKIPPAIQSRMQDFPFKKLSLDFIKDYCEKILKVEEIKYEDNDINFVIDALYPDVRKIVNTLQRDSMTGNLIINREAVFTVEKKISSLIVDIVSSFKKKEKSKIYKSIDMIIKLLYDQDLEFRGLYTNLFFMENFPTPAKIIVNKYSNSHRDCLVPQMHFIAMVFEIIKILSDYQKAIGK